MTQPVPADRPDTGRFNRREFGLLSAGALSAGVLSAGALAAGTVPAGAAAAVGTDCTVDPTAPLEQLRAYWVSSVVNIDWPSATGLSIAQQQAELIAWFDLAVSLRLNAVMLQVRPTADAFWPSPFEPWSQYLSGTQGVDPGYDPLAFAVTEAHNRNLELHAWFNPYRVSMQTDPAQLVPDHPARLHPDWVFPYGPKLYYNPGIPAVRAFVEDAMLDAITRYDVDGAHFDDYFYPYPVTGATLPDADTYAEYGAGFDTVEDWRRHNIDLLISEMNTRIHAAKPWVKFGVSPFGIWRNASADPTGSDTAGTQSYDANFADTRKWVREQWLDYINPQIYWNIGFAVADYQKLATWWSDQVAGTHVQLYVGEATYKIAAAGQPDPWQDPAEMSRHLTLDATLPGVSGNVYFSAKDVKADRIGGMSEAFAEHYAHPAITPAMPHLGGPTPTAPAVTAARRQAGGVAVSWRPGRRPGDATSYAIYRFPAGTRPGDCDRADATDLIATVRATGTAQTYLDQTAAAGRDYTYQVVAVSRLSAQGPPSLPRHATG